MSKPTRLVLRNNKTAVKNTETKTVAKAVWGLIKKVLPAAIPVKEPKDLKIYVTPGEDSGDYMLAFVGRDDSIEGVGAITKKKNGGFTLRIDTVLAATTGKNNKRAMACFDRPGSSFKPEPLPIIQPQPSTPNKVTCPGPLRKRLRQRLTPVYSPQPLSAKKEAAVAAIDNMITILQKVKEFLVSENTPTVNPRQQERIQRVLYSIAQAMTGLKR